MVLMGDTQAQANAPLEIEAYGVDASADATTLSILWSGGVAPYQVQSSDSLPAVWTPETGELVSTAVTVSAGGDIERRFYRVVSGDAVISHEITSPVPGAPLVAGSAGGLKNTVVTFTWVPDGDEPDYWWFYVGTELDPDVHYNSGRLTGDQRQQTVSTVPFDGSDLRVALWSYTGADGPWISKVYTYATEALPGVMSPAPGSTLSSSGEFQMVANGLDVAVWWIYVGSTVGGSEYFNGGIGASVTPTIPYQGVPNNGDNVFVRLFWRLNGDTDFQSRDYVYKAINTGPQ